MSRKNAWPGWLHPLRVRIPGCFPEVRTPGCFPEGGVPDRGCFPDLYSKPKRRVKSRQRKRRAHRKTSS